MSATRQNGLKRTDGWLSAIAAAMPTARKRGMQMATNRNVRPRTMKKSASSPWNSFAVVDEADDGVLAEVIEVLVRERDVDVVEDRKQADQPDPDDHRGQVGQRQPETGSVHPVTPRPLEKERTAA